MEIQRMVSSKTYGRLMALRDELLAVEQLAKDPAFRAALGDRRAARAFARQILKECSRRRPTQAAVRRVVVEVERRVAACSTG